jgi:hypothetical protein
VVSTPYTADAESLFYVGKQGNSSMNSEGTCCNNLFSGFVFQDIRTASPPERKGVYVIRVKQRGVPVTEMMQQVEQIMQRFNWPIVQKKMLNRIKRLQRIGSCPVIYIGSAGTRQESKHTLKGRYSDLAGRHTAMYPIWVLLHFGWDLEYGWIEEENSADLEESLKQKYRRSHKDKLPALVYR